MKRCANVNVRSSARQILCIVGMSVVLLVLVTSDPVPAAQEPAAATTLDLTAAQLQWIEDHPLLRLGPYSNYAPAQFVDEDGEHRGIAADYVALVEGMLGIRFTNVYTETWQELLDRTREGEIDIIAMAAETEDRHDYLAFTAPYLKLPAVIIARDSVDGRLTTDELVGMRVCVVSGYAVQEYLEVNHPDLALDLVPDTRTGLRKVSLGMADAFISDLAVASHSIEQEGIANLRVVGESGYVYEMGFAVRKDWPELAGMIDQALQRITAEQARTIFNQWISLSHETEFASRRLQRTLIIIAVAIALAAIGFLVWNWSLQRRVRQRTLALKNQLTERRRVADELRTSEQRIRLIINTALDAVITIDEKGRVTGWSHQAEAMFGWAREDVIEKSLSEFIVPTQHRAAHEAGLTRYLATGEGPVLNQRIEVTAMHRDGHEFPIELAIAPVPRQNSVEFSAFVRDITERQKNEAELRMHREQLEELVVERTAELRTAKEAAEQALTEVKQLRGLLPICSYCKRIREGADYTRSVEAYLSDHSDAQFSHGVCPDCYKKHVEPELEQL